MGFVDQGQPPGSSHSYRVRAVDPFGNFADSATVTVAVAGSGAFSDYARAVISAGPTWYFRLGDTGTTAANSAGPVANAGNRSRPRLIDATLGSGATRSRPGAISGDSNTATGFNGATSSRGYTSVNTWVDDSMTVEAWFRTTGGGKIVGFGDRTGTSNSVNYDRHLYVSGGRVMWGVFDGTNRILQSATGMNNGAWHHVVGTVGPTGQFLYVDGNLVGSNTSVVKGGRYWGYWRIGGDATWSGNQNFTGDIDEVAVYKTVLTPAVIAQHNQLGRGAAPANLPPTASFTATPSGMTGQFNASASSRLRRHDRGLRVDLRRRDDRHRSDRESHLRDRRHLHGRPHRARRRRGDELDHAIGDGHEHPAAGGARPGRLLENARPADGVRRRPGARGRSPRPRTSP